MYELKTPCYVIDEDRFFENVNIFCNAFSKKWSKNFELGYSIKTNHSQTFLCLGQKAGMMAEAVSDDEYYSALLAGYVADNIIFNGPQKSSQLLEDSLCSKGIINLDNEEELKIIENAFYQGKKISAKLGLRVNFDLESLCPGETTAGEAVSRFGFCLENGDVRRAIDRLHLLGVVVSGLHLHYSTKSRSTNVFREICCKATELIMEFGLKEEIEYIDVGGGFFLGSNHLSVGKPSINAYASVIAKELKKVIDPKKVTLILEPGAALVSTAVTYHTKVINARNIRGVKILTVDGSNLHINPFMNKRNAIYDVTYSDTLERKTYPKQIICGATCMENDRFNLLDGEKELFQRDIMVYHCVGAYTMSFNNNFINVPPYVYLKKDNHFQLVRGKNINSLRDF